MARQLRIEFPGAIYHVMSRGNEKGRIFRKDADRVLFIDTLKDSAELAGIEVIAYVLMDNHYHMIIATPNSNLSDFMRHFAVTYTVRFNRRYSRSGHLFQGRFKAILVEQDPYLIELSRYIHLNPIRGKGHELEVIQQRWEYLKTYPWSSLTGYTDKKKQVKWIRYDRILSYFKGRESDYKRYIIEGLKSGIKNPFDEVRSQIILGSEGFIEEVKKYFEQKQQEREVPAVRSLKKVLTAEEIFSEVSKYFHINKEQLINKSGRQHRQIAIDMMYRYTNLDQKEIGKIFGIDYSTVSQHRRRLAMQIKEDKELQETINRIKDVLDKLSN